MAQDLFNPPEITAMAMVSTDLQDFLEGLSQRRPVFWLRLFEVAPDGDYNLVLQQGPNLQPQYLRICCEKKDAEEPGMQLLGPEVWAEILKFLTARNKGQSANNEDGWVRATITDGSETGVMIRIAHGVLSEVLNYPLPSFDLAPQT